MRRPVLMALLVVVLMAASCAGPVLAADRWAPAAAFGIERPRDCGLNGFALPGSAGCLRLGGSVAVTTTLRTGAAAARVPAGARGLFATHGAERFHVTGRLAADVRVPTDLGPFRVYTEVRVADPGGLGGAGHPR